MNETLKAVLSLSLSGSLLIFLLFLLRPLFKERLSKRWQYYIWLVVIARLLLPFAPETNLMATLFQEIDRSIEQTEAPQSVNSPGKNIVTAVWKNLWLGWLVVALILFIRKITIYQDFVKYIRAGCVEVADIDLLERFDMFYKWLVQLSVCVHWFNPLVYLMSREVGRTCELSCDETVIRLLDPKGRRAYGDTLLNAMGVGGNYKDSFASLLLTVIFVCGYDIL